MRFISRDIDKRTDPALLFDGAKSVVVAGINYYPADKQGRGWSASYLKICLWERLS